MKRAEAKRAALMFVARVAEAQGTAEALAHFLGVPEWIGDAQHPEQHPDAVLVEAEVVKVIAELIRRSKEGRR